MDREINWKSGRKFNWESQKCFVALAVCLLLLAACTGSGSGTGAGSGYITQDTRYASYEIPIGWALSEAHSSDSRMLYFPEHLDVWGEPSYVIVEIFATGQPVESYDEVYAEFLGFMDQMLEMRDENAEVLSHEFFETDFGAAIEIVISDRFDERNFVQTQYFLVLNDYMAVISATNFEDDDIEDSPIVARRVVDTIRFTDLADVPAPELPPNPFGGEWDGNVFWNEMLGLRLTLPDNWTYLSREMISMSFGPEAELSIQVMATSDQDEMLQMFLVPNFEDATINDLLFGFVEQMDDGTVAVEYDEIVEIAIAGQTYLSNTIRAEDGFGMTIVQQNFARELDDDIILAISFLQTGDLQSDGVVFLEAALGE